MGSSERVRIVEISSLIKPQKYHCEIINLKASNSVINSKSNPSKTSRIPVLSGQKIPETPAASALKPSFSQEKTSSKLKSKEEISVNKKKIKKFFHIKEQKNKIVEEEGKEEEVNEGLSASTKIDVPIIPKGENSLNIEKDRKQAVRLLSSFWKSNCSPNKTFEEKRASLTINNEKKECSIDALNVTTVHRVHFNCQPVSVVSLDGNNNNRKESNKSTNTSIHSLQQQQSTVTFSQTISTLWSNSSNKFRRLTSKKHSKDKGRSGKKFHEEKDIKEIGEIEKVKNSPTRRSIASKDSSRQQTETTIVCKTLRKQTPNMNFYVEKNSSLGLAKTPQMQQCSSDKEILSNLPLTMPPQFGFSRSTATHENEHSSSGEQILTSKQVNQTSNQQAPALPPKGISRLPTFLSKLAHPTKVKSSGIPAPKLLSSKSIGNVSLDVTCDSSSVTHVDKNERRSSFVSTNSCDNLSTDSKNFKQSRLSKGSITSSGAKKAQSTHNVSSNTKNSIKNDITRTSTTKSVSNLSTVSGSNQASSTAKQTLIPRSSQTSLSGSRSSKMDQIGGKITESITDRSTVGIPIRPPTTYRKNVSALQASAARFQQHQNKIYSQRMNFFSVQPPPPPTTSVSLSSQIPSTNGISTMNNRLQNSSTTTTAPATLGTARQQSKLTVQATQMDPQHTINATHHSLQYSFQNGNGRYSPHKNRNPYNRPHPMGTQTTNNNSAFKQQQQQQQQQAAAFRTQKEQELQSVNYVRDAVSRYQNQVMNNPTKFGIGTVFQYKTKHHPQSETQNSDNTYNTFTKRAGTKNMSEKKVENVNNCSTVFMDKRDEMSFVTAMVKDCQMRQEIHRLQQQQQHHHHHQQQQQLERDKTTNTKCAIARANLAMVSTNDDTDVEEEIEEMKLLEKAPSGSSLTNDAVMRSHVKRECDEDLSLASLATSLASSSSSFVRHSEQQLHPQQQQQQQHHHHHHHLHQHQQQQQMITDAFPTTGSINRNATLTIDPSLTSSTHSALSTSTTSSFCFEQPHTQISSTSNRNIACTILQNIPGKNQQRLQNSDTSASPESSSTASPSFHKVRTASSATTVSQDSNRDLFFDDEIADQPDLMIMSNNNNNNASQISKDHENCSIKNNVATSQNRSSLRLSLTKSLDYSSGSSSTTTTMAQESLNPSPLATPTNQASIRSANTELENLMQQISLTDQDYSSLNHCPLSPARKALYSHRIIDRSRSFSFQNSNNTSSLTNPSEPLCLANNPRVSGLKKRHSYTSSSNGHVFRKPRPLSFVETEDGSLAFDSPSMRAIAHDIIGVKTLLFRLQGILQNAETQSPFESRLRSVTHPLDLTQSLSSRSSLDSTGDSIAESRSDSETAQILKEENYELRQHIQALEQDALEKDRTIRLLQQQMAKYTTRPRTGSTVQD